MGKREGDTMDTSKMKHLEKMDSLKSYQLMQLAKKLGRVALKVQGMLEQSFLREQIVEVVEAHYDIGKVVDAYEIYGGYVNRSFAVVVERDGAQKDYFLRKYKLGRTDEEIMFEHALITHSIAHGLEICAGLVFTKTGTTYVKPSISKNKFAIYRYLEGEDKYSWDNPIMSDEEYASSAEVLAKFHNATAAFDPRGLQRVEPKILEIMPTLAGKFRILARDEHRKRSKFFAYFTRHLDRMITIIDSSVIPGKDAECMVVNAIHCDFHPGNLKFSDNRAVGVFDFDWAKIDLRLFDVCFALVYNSSYWGGLIDGNMDLGKCGIFVRSYQETLRELQGLEPLNDTELQYFPVMMAMANFYLINWTVTAFFSETEANDYEYLAYLKHSVRQMEWIEQHKQDFAELAASISIYRP
jgi:homoserine kinase type II